jgi:hypothetical protein
MLPIDEPIRLQYQRRRWERMQRKFRRGLITQAELDQAEADLKRAEERPRRVQDPEPPLGVKSVRVPMDRITELGLEYLMGLDLGRNLEKTEMFRVAVRKWALDEGWEPPEELG